MSKPIHIEVVSQSKDGSILLLCHIDKDGVALETSGVAQIIYENNKDLFNKINANTKFIGGSILKTTVNKKDEGFTPTFVRTNLTKDYNEIEIANITLQDNEILPFTRIKNNKGTLIDVDMNSLRPEEEKGPESNRRLSKTDVKMAQKVSETFPLRLNGNDFTSVSTFACRDYFSEKDMSRDHSYRLKVAVASDFDEYVRFVLNKLHESIGFVSRYISSISRSNAYVDGQFKSSFVKRIFNSIGIDHDSEDRIFFDDSQIKSSDFGQAALNCYNGLLLFNSSVDSQSYNTIIDYLLPFKNNTFSNINKVKDILSNLETRIINEFGIKRKTFKDIVYPGKTNKNIKIISSERTPVFTMQRNVLGYYIFRPNQHHTTMTIELTVEEYRRRFVEEQAKYYPRIDPGPASNAMSSKNRSDFVSGNRMTHLTPERIVMGDRSLDINRGVANIDTKFIADLKIVKAAVAENNMRSNIEAPYSPTSNSLASLGVSIGKSKPSLNERSTSEEIDPFVDADKYVGRQSNFVMSDIARVDIPKKKIELKEENTAKRILSSVASAMYLTRPGKAKSINNIKLTNPNSYTRKAIQSDSIDLIKIPPQIKNMVTSDFQSNEEIDPLAVQDTAAVIEETQANVYTMVKLSGFERNSEGKINLSAPKFREVTEEDMVLGGILIKAVEYENAELGILKDKYSGTIYDNLTYIGRKNVI